MRSDSDSNRRDSLARALDLIGLFCSPEQFGRLTAVDPADVPQPARQLLDHRSHMTVTMERFHGTEVRLRVIGHPVDAGADADGAARYAREILLESPSGHALQHGIVRIDLESVGAGTAAEIRSGKRPLGRILIEAGVLMNVHSVALLRIIAGPHLARLFGLPDDSKAALYGRVADIQLNGHAAVELLEIVAPQS